MELVADGWGWRHAGRRRWAVRDVSFRVGDGERVLLLGARGRLSRARIAALFQVAESTVYRWLQTWRCEGRREPKPHAGGPAPRLDEAALPKLAEQLSGILTFIPFWLVMMGVVGSTSGTAVAIFACAMVQIVVQVIYFLHLNTRSEGGWTLIAFIFTVVIVGITIGGSIWVMYHLNTNMMPMMPPTGPR